MRCARVQKAVVEWRLGRLSPASREALEAHLRKCAVCARAVRDERDLATSLTLLRAAPAPRIDVSARVLDAVVRMPRVDRREVPFGQAAWAGASVAAVLAVALGMAALAFPAMLPRAIHETRWILGGFGAVMPAAGRIVSALVLALRSVGTVALEVTAALARALDTVAPAGQTVAGISLLAMTFAWMVLIGRDLRPVAAGPARKER